MGRKLVKQIKASFRPTGKGRLDEVLLSETQPNEGTGDARALGKADAAVSGEVARLDLSDGAFDQVEEFLTLLLRDRSAQVLNLNQPVADEDNLSDFLQAGDPGIADELRVEATSPSGSSG